MLTFRNTSPEDLDMVLSIEQDEDNIRWICAYSRVRHLQVIESKHEFHFVIESEGIIVGFIILSITEKEHDSIEFRRIAIKDKGLGIGRKTVQWIKEWAFKKMGAHRLWLDVFTDNDRARSLYLSEGFVAEGVRRESYLTDGQRRSQMIMSILQQEYFI